VKTPAKKSIPVLDEAGAIAELARRPKPLQCSSRGEHGILVLGCRTVKALTAFYRPEWIRAQNKNLAMYEVTAKTNRAILVQYRSRQTIATWKTWNAFMRDYAVEFMFQARPPTETAKTAGASVEASLSPPLWIDIEVVEGPPKPTI
jgi:hypothetical protein